MINFYRTRAENNDIYSSLESGAKGLVLAAETTIGDYLKICVNFIKIALKKEITF
mgnify:CR=1 FL=1|tara:strand:- start:39 stop:203 length:165 start_codon:yes stop_codon:yes gene_type:complete